MDNRKQLCVRINPALRSALKKLAFKRERSINTLVTEILSQAVAQDHVISEHYQRELGKQIWKIRQR